MVKVRFQVGERPDGLKIRSIGFNGTNMRDVVVGTTSRVGHREERCRRRWDKGTAGRVHAVCRRFWCTRRGRACVRTLVEMMRRGVHVMMRLGGRIRESKMVSTVRRVMVPVIGVTCEWLFGGLEVRLINVRVLPEAFVEVLVDGGLTGGQAVVISGTVGSIEVAPDVTFEGWVTASRGRLGVETRRRTGRRTRERSRTRSRRVVHGWLGTMNRRRMRVMRRHLGRRSKGCT